MSVVKPFMESGPDDNILNGEVEFFNDLPTASAANADKIYLVQKFSLLTPLRRSGLYYSDGANWIKISQLEQGNIGRLNNVTDSESVSNALLQYNLGTGIWNDVSPATVGGTIDLNDLLNTDLADPDADRIVFWDDSDGQYEFLTVGNGLLLTGNTITALVIVDTRDTIVALTPTADQIAFATDTKRFMFADGTNWQESSTEYKPRTAKDMGHTQDSSQLGYGETYITDKTLHNVRILESVLNAKGSIKVSEDIDGIQSLQIFINGAFNDLPADITFIDADGNYIHSINNQTIEIMSGNSTVLGMNGLPKIQQYKVSMGAFPFPRVLDGNIP